MSKNYKIRRIQKIFFKNKQLSIPDIRIKYNDFVKNRFKHLSIETEQGRLKRKISEHLVDLIPKEKLVIDAFAGAGILTIIYALSGRKVYAIEKDPFVFRCLKKNIEIFGFKNVRLFQEDNLKVLGDLKRSWDYVSLIDLDPYNECVRQTELSLKIIKNGILLTTSGEIMHYKRFTHERDIIRKRYGKNPKSLLDIIPIFASWVKNQRKDARLRYFYVTKEIYRTVWEIGNFKIEDNLFDKFGNPFALFDFRWAKLKEKEGEKIVKEMKKYET